MSTPSQNRPFAFAAFVVGAIYLLFVSVYHMGIAHAAAVEAAAGGMTLDPLTFDAGWNLISTYGWTWGGMYIVFQMTSWLLKRNQVEHWIAEGKTLAYVVAAVGIGITVVQAKMTGAPWSGVAMTVVVALFKLLSPDAAKAPSSSGSVASATVVVAVLFGCALGATQIACNGSGKGAALARAEWDCTAPVRADAVAAITPAVISVIKATASADGKLIDTSAIKGAISKANLLSEAGVLLSCAAASAFAILSRPSPTPPGSAAAAPLVLDPVALLAAWAEIKATQIGGDARLITSAGAM